MSKQSIAIFRLLFSLPAIASAGLSLYLLLGDEILYAFVTHAFCAACGIFACSARAGDGGQYPIFEIVIALTMPCVGGAVACIYQFGGESGKREMVAEEYGHYINANERIGGELYLGKTDASTLNRFDVESVADILRSNASNDEKRLGIAALAQMETPEALSILRETVRTASTEVRFYAASVLGRLEEHLSNRLSELERLTHEFKGGESSSHLELARACFDFVYYDIAIGERKAAFLEKAEASITRALLLESTADHYLLAGRIMLEKMEWNKARDYFTQYLRKSSYDPKGFLWRAEANFHLREYVSVRDDCVRASEAGAVPRRMREATDAWVYFGGTGNAAKEGAA